MHFSTDKPCNKITVGGETVLDMDVGNGWTITDVWFNQDVPIELIDFIKVKFEKREIINEQTEPQTDSISAFADILFDKDKQEQFLKECEAMGIKPQTDMTAEQTEQNCSEKPNNCDEQTDCPWK